MARALRSNFDTRMVKRTVGILGVTSSVGNALLPLFVREDVCIIAFSREKIQKFNEAQKFKNVKYYELGQSIHDIAKSHSREIQEWVSLLPMWVLVDYLDWLKALGIKRIVGLSSTSRFTKMTSLEVNETVIVKKLAESEERLIQWAKQHEVEWIILRPTLIYGYGRDKNISFIASFIRRFGFFPLYGKGQGYRQPVHVDDVATACYQALNQHSITNRAYNISGGDKITYKQMVNRIFIEMNMKPRFISMPLIVLSIGLSILKIFPKYRCFTLEMFTRMNQDMIFDHHEANIDFGFSPRKFTSIE